MAENLGAESAFDASLRDNAVVSTFAREGTPSHDDGPSASDRLGIPESASDRALRRTIDEVYSRRGEDGDAGAERAERAEIRAEREGKEKRLEAEGFGPAPGTPFKGTMRDSMEAAYRRVERRAADREAKAMPVDTKRSIDESMQAAVEWMATPEANKRLYKGAADQMKDRREAARALGLTLEESEAAQLQKRMELHDQISPLLQRVAALVPDDEPTRAIANFVDRLQRDPVSAIRALERQYGVTGAPQQHYSPPQAASAARERALGVAAVTTVNAFAASRPDFDSLQPAMVQALDSGAVRRTGNMAHDLAAAYAYARGGARARP